MTEETQTDRVKKAIKYCLSDTAVTSEVVLQRRVMDHMGQITQSEYETAMGLLHSANEIRWVAYNGWILGGRPDG